MIKFKIDSKSEDKTQYGIKITFVSGKNKYSFYDTKRGGGKTVAYEQYLKYGFKTGDEVSCEVEEKPETFVNDAGKTINFTRRTIKYFQEVQDTPVATFAPKKTLTLEGLDERITALENKEINDIDEIPF